jgi:hypothetical protein
VSFAPQLRHWKASVNVVYWLLLLASAPDIQRLGGESFDQRELAEESLRARGLWALPALLAGLAGDSPDVREACDRLMVRWRVLWLWVRAAGALGVRDAPHPEAFFNDHLLRRYTHRLAVLNGCTEQQWISWLLPERDDWDFFRTRTPIEDVALTLAVCRRKLGTPGPFAPMPRTKETR